MDEIERRLSENNSSVNDCEIDGSEDITDSQVIRAANRHPKTFGKTSVHSNNDLNHTNRTLPSIAENPCEDESGVNGSGQTPEEIPEQSPLTPHMVDKFRRKLRFYFMSPVDKWKAKRRLPFKLVIQVIKIILVTSQLLIFGFDMSSHMSQESNAIISFRELFLSNWDPVREVMTYPPAAGPYAVYSKDDFYSTVDYAIKVFSNISDLSIGSFGYAVDRNLTTNNMSDIVVRRQRYANGEVDPTNYIYYYDNKVLVEYLKIGELYPPGDQRWQTEFSSLQYFNAHNFSLNFDRLLVIELVFPMRTIYLNSLVKYNAPKCYDLNVTITFDNTQHDGQMPVQLTTTQTRHRCDGNLANSNEDTNEKIRRQVLSWLVIVFSFLSLILCVRSLYSGQLLRSETDAFFERHFQRSLTFAERTDFIDFWIVTIVINDILILTGSGLKMQLESTIIESVHYTTVSILLGFGNLLVWAGLLRYLGFFRKYNILILTLSRAMPNVFRFMLCAILLYGGFSFCGWVVLGPYHLKFRTLSLSSECLFSLMNGDDMFATFYITDASQQPIIWWFSRIYLYLFVCLFIYVVLSLFIALIMDSYETIKDYYQNGMPLNGLQKFIAECRDSASSRAYLEDRHTSIADTFNLCFDCFNRRSANYSNF